MTATPPPPPGWSSPDQPTPPRWTGQPPQPQQVWGAPQPGGPAQPQPGWTPQYGAQPAQPWQQTPVALVGAPGPGPTYPQQPFSGEFGYSYAPMPSYPPPQFPPPSQPPRRGVPTWVWVIGAVMVVAIVVLFALPRSGDPGEQPTESTAEPTDGFGQPNSSSTGTFSGEHMIETINAALAAKDRPAFFRFVDGDAVAPLSLWWDNMDVLQWTAGAFSVAPGQLTDYVDDTVTIRVTLGAVTAGSPTIPSQSDHPAAGLAYAPSNVYEATIRVTDDGSSGVITGWDLAGTGAPWDLEPLYSVVGDHSVVAGYADEKDLIDRVAPMGDEGATWVIETYESATGVANAQRFTTFVSEDAGRFNDWFIEDTSGWVADRSGTMFPQRRPYDAAGIDPVIAVGPPSTNAGGILTIGPNGLLYGDDFTLDTVVHEFVHAMHTTNVPVESWPGSTLVEGWAVYNESLFRGDGAFGVAGTYVGGWVRNCAESDPFQGEFPTQSDFADVESVTCAYNLSGSTFAYAASLGVDVYAIADYALAEGMTLPEAVAASGGPVIDSAGWWSWVQENYSG